jgi:uncharacterized protein YbjT (DUF2867 family)
MSYTIVRGAGFMETWHEMVGEPLLKNGKVMFFGRGEARGNFVSVKDVARFVVLALHDERLRNRLINVGGPENLTQNQAIEILERVTGRRARRTRLPVAVLRTMSVLARPFHPGVGRMLRMGALMGSTDTLFDPEELLSEFPGEFIRFEDATREWFERR